MDINLDLSIKIGTWLLGVISTLFLAINWRISHRGRLREEYKFARDFMFDLKEHSDMHPFLRQKGYQAIAGGTLLSASEIEYLLMLRDSADALKDYVTGRKYLKHFATAGEQQITFAPKFEKPWPRLWRKGWYFTWYFVFFAFAFAPFLMSSVHSLEPRQVVLLFGFTLGVFVPLGTFSLRAGVRIARAEVLVARQFKHSKEIILARG